MEHKHKINIFKNLACFYPEFLSDKPDYSIQIFLHGYNVAEISYKIGKIIGLSTEKCELLYKLGMLHDIGKSKIPPHIILKPSKLNENEIKIMQKHPVYSEEIYLNITKNSNIIDSEYHAKIIRCHHENVDGTGYPDGLKGEEIPLLSRIITIADIFEAITHPRIYRPYPVERPLDLMKSFSGKKIDKYLFEASYNLLESYLKNDEFLY